MLKTTRIIKYMTEINIGEQPRSTTELRRDFGNGVLLTKGGYQQLYDQCAKIPNIRSNAKSEQVLPLVWKFLIIHHQSDAQAQRAIEQSSPVTPQQVDKIYQLYTSKLTVSPDDEMFAINEHFPWIGGVNIILTAPSTKTTVENGQQLISPNPDKTSHITIGKYPDLTLDLSSVLTDWRIPTNQPYQLSSSTTSAVV